MRNMAIWINDERETAKICRGTSYLNRNIAGVNAILKGRDKYLRYVKWNVRIKIEKATLRMGRMEYCGKKCIFYLHS